MMKKKAFEKNTDKFHLNERDHVIPQNVTIGVAKSQKRKERRKKKKKKAEQKFLNCYMKIYTIL